MVTRKLGSNWLFTNSASTTEELKAIVTKCNEASSHLGPPKFLPRKNLGAKKNLDLLVGRVINTRPTKLT
ncbi:hypothetical protein D0A34_16240 [Microcoleus vaginatus PCC 9802]|nr:hypothetical protein D0A34_16240 [Microcoleus vaginatus PCC 9802]